MLFEVPLMWFSTCTVFAGEMVKLVNPHRVLRSQIEKSSNVGVSQSTACRIPRGDPDKLLNILP